MRLGNLKFHELIENPFQVNLPNHYVSKRSLPDFVVTEMRANEYINDLTVSVLEKIENFQHKYLT